MRAPPTANPTAAIDRFLDTLADFVTHRRALVLLGPLLATAVLALGIPRVTADFTPSDLFARFEDQEAVTAEFRAEFGNTDNVLLVLVRSEDVLSRDTLQYVHQLTRALDSQAWAGRVDALTTLPLPREPDAAARTEAESGFLAGLYVAGALASSHVSVAASSIRGAEPRVEITTELPAVLVNLAVGNGTVQPAVSGSEVSDADRELLVRAVERSRLLQGRLVSRDRTLTAIAVSLAPGLSRNDAIARVVRDARELLVGLPPPDGVETFFGGLPYLRSAVIEKMQADQKIMLPLALAVCILILFATFRWLPAMLLPTAAVVVSAVMLVGLMGWIREPFNIINNIVPLLIIIIGISNTIHLVNRYAEEIRAGADRVEACRESVKRMAVACFLTSFTTAIGFASLAVSRTEVLRRFGILAAVGVLIAYFVTITFLPAALSYVRAPGRDTAAAREGAIERFMEWLTRAILRHPVPVLAVSVVVFTWAAQECRRIEIDSAVLDQFSADDEIYITTRLVEEKLAGVRPLEVYLSSSQPGRFDDPVVLNAIDDIAAWARAQPGVVGTMSYADYLHEVIGLSGGDANARFDSATRIQTAAALLASGDRNPVAPYVNEERTRARLNIGMADVGAQATIRFAEALEVEIAARLSGVRGVGVRLTGDAYSGSKGLDAVVSDLLGSLGLAVFIIFGFMTLLFRSARLAAISVPPNVIPLVVTMAFMVVGGVPLNAATAIIFSISIGLAVDGSIHVLARFREEVLRCATVDDALVAAARGTGKAIIMTCVSLMLGFGVMLFSSFVPVRRFGQLIAITVFGCLLATVIILPALLKVAWFGGSEPGDGDAAAD